MKSTILYKRIVFYTILIALPVVIWLAIEYLANSITHRFDPLKVDHQKKSLYINQDYFNDFFLYDIERVFNTSASNRVLHLEKGNRFRIFCFGGSTTAGYPYNTLPEYNCPASFPNYLRGILQYNRNLPEIEILNVGSNAFNSLSVLKLFHDLEPYDPDLIIVYCGHNEYFGPNEFTLSKKFNQRLTQKFVHHALLSVRQTYLYQGLRWLLKKIRKKGLVEYKNYAGWSLQNTLSQNDPYHAVVQKNFQQNLTELVRRAQQKGIQVVLCTPISNLTFPPFVSRFARHLDPTQTANWDTLRNRASALYDQGRYAEALDFWQKLYALDSSYAEVHYYTGMNYARLDDYEIANQALSQAADLDALPFRAKCSIRELCREVARNEKVILADTDQFFRQLSGKYYPEPSLLLDHVHPTEPGYYYLALFLARTLVAQGVFPGVRELQYPPLVETRAALNIYDFVAYKVEYDFTQKSYLAQLSELNPAIKYMLLGIREHAASHAKEIEQQLLKAQQAEEEKEKK
ncbi:GDSL-type esterase/lipase family protein [candidate division KSB1 bacterium]|nr:GDSL-type esterase/lipase family protein [candidate division KSB1 bacterium]